MRDRRTSETKPLRPDPGYRVAAKWCVASASSSACRLSSHSAVTVRFLPERQGERAHVAVPAARAPRSRRLVGDQAVERRQRQSVEVRDAPPAGGRRSSSSSALRAAASDAFIADSMRRSSRPSSDSAMCRGLESPGPRARPPRPGRPARRPARGVAGRREPRLPPRPTVRNASTASCAGPNDSRCALMLVFSIGEREDVGDRGRDTVRSAS